MSNDTISRSIKELQSELRQMKSFQPIDPNTIRRQCTTKRLSFYMPKNYVDVQSCLTGSMTFQIVQPTRPLTNAPIVSVAVEVTEGSERLAMYWPETPRPAAVVTGVRVDTDTISIDFSELMPSEGTHYVDVTIIGSVEATFDRGNCHCNFTPMQNPDQRDEFDVTIS